jgi:formaldehyde-activating enzyme involved in methanogenesis
MEAAGSDVMIAVTTVHPRALDRHKLFASVHAAATQAIANAFERGGGDGSQT